jgi:hypothetical protein
MKKSRNRKTKYFNEYFYYKDEKLKILASESLGVYKEILIATIEQLDTSIAIHKKNNGLNYTITYKYRY